MSWCQYLCPETYSHLWPVSLQLAKLPPNARQGSRSPIPEPSKQLNSGLLPNYSPVPLVISRSFAPQSLPFLSQRLLKGSVALSDWSGWGSSSRESTFGFPSLPTLATGFPGLQAIKQELSQLAPNSHTIATGCGWTLDNSAQQLLRQLWRSLRQLKARGLLQQPLQTLRRVDPVSLQNRLASVHPQAISWDFLCFLLLLLPRPHVPRRAFLMLGQRLHCQLWQRPDERGVNRNMPSSFFFFLVLFLSCLRV